MRRFILMKEPNSSGRICLEGKDYHYLARVLRLREGASFRALLPAGEEVLLQVVKLGPGKLEAECIPEKTIKDLSDPEKSHKLQSYWDQLRQVSLIPQIILCQALVKGPKMDQIVRQAVEVGVTNIVPFVSHRSVPRPKLHGEKEKRRERWNRIVKEARQQSGSNIDTMIEETLDLVGLINYWEDVHKQDASALGIVLHQDPLAQGTLHGYLNHGQAPVLLVIGPEGGLTDDEISLLVQAGFKPLLVNANVLRTETAALFAIASVYTLLWENSSWIPSNESRA